MCVLTCFRMSFDFKPLQSPVSVLCVGVSASGKTHYWLNLIEKGLVFEPNPTRIVIFSHFDTLQFSELQSKFPGKVIVEKLDGILDYQPHKFDLCILDEGNLCFLKLGQKFEAKLDELLLHDVHHINFSIIVIVQQLLRTPAFPLLHKVQAVSFPAHSQQIFSLLKFMPLLPDTKSKLQNTVRYLATCGTFVLCYIAPSYNNIKLAQIAFSHLEHLPKFCQVYTMNEMSQDTLLSNIISTLPNGTIPPEHSYTLVKSKGLGIKPVTESLVTTDLQKVDKMVMSHFREMSTPATFRKNKKIWKFLMICNNLRIDKQGTTISFGPYSCNIYEFLNECNRPIIASYGKTKKRKIDQNIIGVAKGLVSNPRFPDFVVTNKLLLSKARKLAI